MYYSRLGYLVDEAGKLEDLEKFLLRMEGCVKLYAAIIQATPPHKEKVCQILPINTYNILPRSFLSLSHFLFLAPSFPSFFLPFFLSLSFLLSLSLSLSLYLSFLSFSFSLSPPLTLLPFSCSFSLFLNAFYLFISNILLPLSWDMARLPCCSYQSANRHCV